MADKYDINRGTLYYWQNKLVGEVMKPKKNEIIKSLTKDELLEEIEKLKKEHLKLEMENKILKKANELLKKEIGTDFNHLTNKEKTIIISALQTDYKISSLINILNLKKSTYYYEIKRLKYDKYANIRTYIKNTFNSNFSCYGYRRMKKALAIEYNINISEK